MIRSNSKKREVKLIQTRRKRRKIKRKRRRKLLRITKQKLSKRENRNLKKMHLLRMTIQKLKPMKSLDVSEDGKLQSNTNFRIINSKVMGQMKYTSIMCLELRLNNLRWRKLLWRKIFNLCVRLQRYKDKCVDLPSVS